MIDYNDLLNIAKDVLKSKKKNLIFTDLWKEVCKKANISASDANEMIGDFYQKILESNLFFFEPKTREWGLRENIKFETYQKMNDAFLSNASDDIKEKDYKSDMSLIEMAELEHGTRNDKTSVLDMNKDDEDDDNDDNDLDIDEDMEE